MRTLMLAFIFLSPNVFAHESTNYPIDVYTEHYQFKSQLTRNQYGLIVENMECVSLLGQKRIEDRPQDLACVANAKKAIAPFLESRPKLYLVLEVMHAEGRDEHDQPSLCWNYPGEDDGIISVLKPDHLFVRVNCDISVWKPAEKIQKQLLQLFNK